MAHTGEGIRRLPSSFCNCYSWVMNRRNTPLAAWMRAAPVEHRERLALLSGTTVNYLWQIATCRREPSVSLAMGIEDGTKQIRSEMRGRNRLPVVTMREIATMKALEGL